MNKISDLAHAFLPWIGILLALQAPITAYLIDVGIPVRIVGLVFGGLGLIAVAWSKHIDSQNNAIKVASQAQIQSAPIPPTAQIPAPPS